jgi:hypothetical protein
MLYAPEIEMCYSWGRSVQTAGAQYRSEHVYNIQWRYLMI